MQQQAGANELSVIQEKRHLEAFTLAWVNSRTANLPMEKKPLTGLEM